MKIYLSQILIKLTKLKTLIPLILMISCFTSSLVAHQGTTINYRIFFKFDAFNIIGVGESWTFDELTSKMLLEKYKVKENTILNKKESIDLGNKIMDGLENVRYFTYIYVNGKDLGVLEASNFKAKIDGSILTVAFNNQLSTAVDVSKKTLSVQVKDIDYTIETKLLPKKPVVLLGIPEENCNINIEEKKNVGGVFTLEELFLMDFAPPKEIKINCKK